MDFGWPNVEIGGKMANSQLLFLALEYHTVYGKLTFEVENFRSCRVNPPLAGKLFAVNPSALFVLYGCTANYRYNFAWPTNFCVGTYHLQSIMPCTDRVWPRREFGECYFG